LPSVDPAIWAHLTAAERQLVVRVRLLAVVVRPDRVDPYDHVLALVVLVGKKKKF